MAAGPYTRDVIYGYTLNLRTAEMYEKARRRFGFATILTQGSYNAGVTQSAGTHDGGGALDVRARDLTSTQRKTVETELRRVGFAAWIRTPDQGDWPYHVHAIAVGDKELSTAAKNQVIDYYAGFNGLANNGPDTGTRAFVGVVHPQELYMSFYGPEHWDEADFAAQREDFKKWWTEAEGWRFNIKDLVKADGSVRNADKMLALTHLNTNQTETLAGEAKAAAVGAQNAAASAQTSSAAALQAANETKQAVKDLEAKLFPPA